MLGNQAQGVEGAKGHVGQPGFSRRSGSCGGGFWRGSDAPSDPGTWACSSPAIPSARCMKTMDGCGRVGSSVTWNSCWVR